MKLHTTLVFGDKYSQGMQGHSGLRAVCGWADKVVDQLEYQHYGNEQ